MGILDTIKKKLKSEDSKEQKSQKIQKETVESESKSSGKKTNGMSNALFSNIIKNPRITEKSSMLQADHQYVFHVDQRTCKPEIKKAIENIFNVRVVKVNTINVSGKNVRLGKHEGRTSDFKKAIVTLKEGDKIDIGT